MTNDRTDAGNGYAKRRRQFFGLSEEEFNALFADKQEEAGPAAIAGDHAADRTRYDFVTAETRQSSLSKRDVVLAIVRHIVSTGVTPEQVEAAAGRREIFVSVGGNIEGDRFKAEVTSLRPGDSIFPKRYFAADDQLFHSNGRTYALTNQWTGATMETLAATLATRFPAAAFKVTPALQPERAADIDELE